MAESGTFTVVLAKSGREFVIPPDKTILEVLENHGIYVSNACRQGICGSCETRVLSGTPDHRDSVLPHDDAEIISMTICCSRARSDRLVLDL
jgi:vanillate O-demethylase ferredoxin subunit